MTVIEAEAAKVRTQLAQILLASNISSGFTGKFECWLDEGIVTDISNTQKFRGISIIDINKIKLYTVA